MMFGASLGLGNILLKQPETRLLSLCQTKVKSHMGFRAFYFYFFKKTVLKSKLDSVIENSLLLPCCL